MAEMIQDRLLPFRQPESSPLSTADRLSESHLDAIVDRYGGGFRQVRFLPGIPLIHQGDHGEHDDFLFVILKGTVAVSKQSDDGMEREIARLGGSGALTGEIRALNSVIPRTRAVRAVTEVEAIRLFSSDIAGWNGAPKPWGDMHAFLTDLARKRYDAINPEERRALGIDAESLLKNTTPGRSEDEGSRRWPTKGFNPPILMTQRIAEIRSRTQRQKNPKNP